MHYFFDIELARASGGNPAFDEVPEDCRAVQVVGSCYARELGKNVVSVIWVATHIIRYAFEKAITLVLRKDSYACAVGRCSLGCVNATDCTVPPSAKIAQASGKYFLIVVQAVLIEPIDRVVSSLIEKPLFCPRKLPGCCLPVLSLAVHLISQVNTRNQDMRILIQHVDDFLPSSSQRRFSQAPRTELSAVLSRDYSFGKPVLAPSRAPPSDAFRDSLGIDHSSFDGNDDLLFHFASSTCLMA